MNRYFNRNGGEQRWGHVNEELFDSVGWPVRLLWVGWEDTDVGLRQIPFTGLSTGLTKGTNQYDIIFPIRPILSGQLFYATFWLAIVMAVPFTRCRFRIWRGRCVNCNYDLRANTTGVCPECGVMVIDWGGSP